MPPTGLIANTPTDLDQLKVVAEAPPERGAATTPKSIHDQCPDRSRPPRCERSPLSLSGRKRAVRSDLFSERRLTSSLAVPPPASGSVLTPAGWHLKMRSVMFESSAPTAKSAEVTNSVSARSLAAVAFLKARFDENADHLDIFMPLLLDAVAALRDHSFTSAEVQGLMVSRHGLSMPQQAITTLLARAGRRGNVRRSDGRYHAVRHPVESPNVANERLRIDAEHAALASALRSHAQSRGLMIQTDDSALTMLFDFLENQQVGLLLDGASPPVGVKGLRREFRLIAEFVYHIITTNDPLRSPLTAVIEGIILYNVAFLPNFPEATQRFSHLTVFFDSGVVRQAVGYEGPAAQALARETVNVFKAAGIHCLVFDKTILEIKRLLSMYEHKLASSAGRLSLRPGTMSRHLLTQRFGPSDLKQMSALLEHDVSAAGLQIATMPPRIPKYTLDEKSLAEKLANPDTGDEESARVIHDVDCVAGVLTMRRGHRSTRVQDARVLFVSHQATVIKTVNEWFKLQNETGVSPMVHVRWISNLAWLKHPQLIRDFKLREMVALCAAALRPSRKTWERFLRHLENLRKTGAITSDEQAAVVVSELTDTCLSDVESMAEGDVDARTLDDVIERVKTSYSAAASAEIAAAKVSADARIASALAERDAAVADARNVDKVATNSAISAREKARELQLRVERQSGLAASVLSAVLSVGPALGAVIGAGVLIRHYWTDLGHATRAGAILVVMFLVLETIGVLGHVKHAREWFREWLHIRIRRWWIGQ